MLMRNASTDQGFKELVRSIGADSDLSASLQKVRSRIIGMEQEHGMSSEDMRDKVTAGSLRETDALCTWLMLLNRRDRLVKKAG